MFAKTNCRCVGCEIEFDRIGLPGGGACNTQNYYNFKVYITYS